MSNYRKYADCTNEELENLHDDAVSCDDYEWADRIAAVLDSRQDYRRHKVEEPPRSTDSSDTPF